MRNVEIVQTENTSRQEERLEVMSSVRSGVKMATAVTAYKVETSGYEPLGKMGLAIVHKKDPNYQLLTSRAPSPWPTSQQDLTSERSWGTVLRCSSTCGVADLQRHLRCSRRQGKE